MGYEGLLIELGFGILFNECKLLIINLDSVVLPTPSSPLSNKISPFSKFLHNSTAKDSIFEISKI